MTHFVHPQGLCESELIGEGTRIWAFAHVLPKARIGRDCNVCDHVFVENDVIVGDRVTIKCGVQLWDGVRLEDDVFVGPNATFTNDRFPRSKQYPDKFPQTVVRQGASIGANAVLLPGITVGRGAMVNAETIVTRSVPPNAIVAGNPARIIGYANTAPALDVRHVPTTASSEPRTRDLAVPGVRFHRMRTIQDLQKELTVSEFDRELPFDPRRYFVVYDVPNQETRGKHTHQKYHQFLLYVRDTVSIAVDDDRARDEIRLDHPSAKLHVPPII